MAKTKGPLSAKALEAAHREVRKEGHPAFALRRLAALMGVSKTSIIKWRRDPRYEQAMKDEAMRLVQKRLEEREREWLASKPKRNMEQLDVDAHNNWVEPTQCMACGKIQLIRCSTQHRKVADVFDLTSVRLSEVRRRLVVAEIAQLAGVS